jgi:hypothetical protein
MAAILAMGEFGIDQRIVNIIKSGFYGDYMYFGSRRLDALLTIIIRLPQVSSLNSLSIAGCFVAAVIVA